MQRVCVRWRKYSLPFVRTFRAGPPMASFVIERSTPAVRAKELATFVAEAGLSVHVAAATPDSKAVYELTADGSAFMEKAKALVEPGGSAKPNFDEFLQLALKYVPRLFDGTVGDQGRATAVGPGP